VTTSTLTISGATAGLNGYLYRCVVSGTCAPQATSNSATLTVNTAPAITAHPSDSAVYTGTNASFTVAASGSGLIYRWQANPGPGFADLTNNATYSNVATATLSITSASGAMTGTAYRCVVTGTCSPQATSNSATLTVSPWPLLASVKAYLHGAYNATSGQMDNALNANGHLESFAQTQPYGAAPWSYGGTESVASGFFSLHPTVVDWVLLELRSGTASSTTISRRAAFILQNGSIVDRNGSDPVAFSSIPDGSYYIVLRHRNHLAVMTPTAVALTNAAPSGYSFDFSSGSSQAYGSNALQLVGPGVYGLYSGDANGNAFIDTNDFTEADNNQWVSGYLRYDTNLDGYIDTNDFTSSDNSQWQGEQVP
jgi:hypothetical protein